MLDVHFINVCYEMPDKCYECSARNMNAIKQISDFTTATWV